MPRNGSGSYSLPQAAFVAGTTISSASVNSDFSDIATALTGSLPRDGQAGMTGQLKIPDGSAIAPALTYSNEPNTGFTRVGTGVIGLTILGTQFFTFSATGATGSFQGGVPAGTVVSFAGAAAQVPTGWVLCFGQAISRTTNTALFTAIGVLWGSGDGVTTFNVPDFRDYTLVGKGDMGGSDAGRLTTAFYGTSPIVLGNVGGTQSKALITANVPAHTHSGTTGNDSPDHTHGYNAYSGIHQDGTQAADVPINVFTAQSTGASTRHSHPFTTDNGTGSATAFATVQPSIIVNKIIYTGG